MANWDKCHTVYVISCQRGHKVGISGNLSLEAWAEWQKSLEE